jgi:hypothetical protein
VELAAAQFEAAVGACDRSLEIRRALLRDDPANAQLVRGLGIMHHRLATLAAARGAGRAAAAHGDSARRHYAAFFDGREGALNARRDELELLLDRVAWGPDASARRLAATEARVAGAALAARGGLTDELRGRLDALSASR